jgi:uncharacterized protein (TIGR03790 family)
MMPKLLLFLTIAGASFNAVAASPGEEVIVVYNSRLPESKQVADHYAARRQVPDQQIVGLKLPVTETMTRAEFLDQLQKPLLQRLVDDKLFVFGPATNQMPNAKPGDAPFRRVVEARVRYATLCYGVPLKILADPTLVEAGTERLAPEFQRNEAAVDSQLVLLPSVEQKSPWAGPLVNPLYGVTNGSQLHPTNGLLMVSRLDGPSPALASGLVDKALEAETNGLWGRAYFDSRGFTNGGYVLGDQWMRGSAEVARRMGFETELDEQPGTFTAGHPMSDIALYAGWYDQAVSGPFTRPTVDFRPGAFAYHLYSFSAREIRASNSTWVAVLLQKGATCTMGATEEPYLSGTPDLSVFLSRWAFLQFTFGEAAWASQNTLSWQTTVVGDPLYRPFGRRPEEMHFDLERRGRKEVEWSHLKVVNRNLLLGTTPGELVNYLESIPNYRKSAVLTEKTGDLYFGQKKLTDSLDTYEAALKRGPTLPQKLRLMLKLAQGRLLLGPDDVAFDWYQKFLKEFPDYPDLLTLYQQLQPLAKRLGKKEALEQCEKEIRRLAPPPPANAPAKS